MKEQSENERMPGQGPAAHRRLPALVWDVVQWTDDGRDVGSLGRATQTLLRGILVGGTARARTQ